MSLHSRLAALLAFVCLPVASVSAQQTVHDSLGTQPMTDTLGDVTVSGARPLFERKIDRTIFHVSASISAAGGNALEAIRRSPGVVVRENEAIISIAGKSSVRVLVDNRPLQLSGEDLIAYLQAIPADNLERIEVITTPPAQYDAAGNSGLINIVLKKQRRAGLNGDVRAGYEQSGYGTLTGGSNLNYRNGPFNGYGSVSYSDGAKAAVERLNTFFPDQAYLLANPYKRDTRTVQYTLGADYELDKSSVLGIQLTGTDFNRQYEGKTDLQIQQRRSGTVDSLVRTNSVSSRINQNNIANLNYVRNIDSAGKKLTVNLSRLWYDGRNDNNYDTQNYYGFYLMPTGIASRNQNRGRQSIRITTAQADAELPYTWANLTLGGRLSYTENRSRNNFLYFDKGEFHDDPSVSNEFHYTEQVQALYLSGQKRLGKWELQAGLRGEWTQTEGRSIKLARSAVNRYVNLFPTVYVQYTPQEHHAFNINYSKRIDRPGYRALDPYRSYSTPYSYIEGNPFLKPSYVHSLELGYTYKSRYSISAFQQIMPGTFGQVFFADAAQKTTFVRMENYGDFYFSGINTSASFQPLGSWELQVQASGNRQQVKVHVTNQVANEKPVYTAYVMLNNSIPLNKAKTLLAQANLFYISRYMNDLLRVEPQANLDAGIRALLLDKKLVISLSGNDLLRTLTVKGTNSVTGQTVDHYFDERHVRLIVNYKFGNNKIKGRRERSMGIEAERDRT